MARAAYDEGSHDLAFGGVLDPDYCCLAHGGMFHQDAFDVFGEHAVARNLDQFLDAPGKGEIAVCVEMANITCMDPTVHQRFPRFLGLVPVALEAPGATQQDLALFTMRQGLACLYIDYPAFHAGKQAPVRSPAYGIGWCHRVERMCFRQAVSGLVYPPVAGKREPAFGKLRGRADAEAGGGALAQARQVEALALGVVHDRRQHGGDAFPVGWPVPLDGLDRRACIEAVMQNDGATQINGDVDATEHPRNMVERWNRKMDVVTGKAAGAR